MANAKIRTKDAIMAIFLFIEALLSAYHFLYDFRLGFKRKIQKGL